MLEQLHQAHMGIEKTKWRARAAILWPQINQKIKNMVKRCSNCQQNERKQQHEPMKASNVPQCTISDGWIRLTWLEWSRFCVSGWLPQQILGHWEALQKGFWNSYEEVKTHFSRMGIPEVMRSANGPQYSIHHQVLRSLQRTRDFNT